MCKTLENIIKSKKVIMSENPISYVNRWYFEEYFVWLVLFVKTLYNNQNQTFLKKSFNPF